MFLFLIYLQINFPFFFFHHQLQSAMTASISPVITTLSSTSPVLIHASSSSPPQRANSSSPSIINSSKLLNGGYDKKHIQNGIITTTSATINGLSQNHISFNLTTNDGISPALLSATNAASACTTTMPLNLNINQHVPVSSTNGLQIITTGGNKNGVRQQMFELNDQNGSIVSVNGVHSTTNKNAKDQIINGNGITSKLSDSEPPTKVFKLINGNTIALATVDKDNKLIPSNQLTLSQMVVSQIPLIASSQALRVIGQAPNGLTTIDLSNGMF